MNTPVYTGKCGTYKCGHAESAHDKHGDHWCKHKTCTCTSYQPVADQEAYNTVDGLPPIELYEFQKQYLRGLPAKYIFSADTGKTEKSMIQFLYEMYSKRLRPPCTGKEYVRGASKAATHG